LERGNLVKSTKGISWQNTNQFPTKQFKQGVVQPVKASEKGTCEIDRVW